MMEENGNERAIAVSLTVKVEEARLQRDEESGLPALVWKLRVAAGGLLWHKQIFTGEETPHIKDNLAHCGIVCSFAELPAQLIKAKDCELEARRTETSLIFVRRLDHNVFAGTVEGQNVAEEIPL